MTDLKKVQKTIKVAFTPHDLRRTASSAMKSMGIPRLTVSKILNHSEGGVTAKHYDHYAYDKEKQVAMLDWDRKLNQILTNPKRAKTKKALPKNKIEGRDTITYEQYLKLHNFRDFTK